MEWKKRLTRADGKPRRSYSLWSIPVQVKRAAGYKDGDSLSLTIEIGGESFSDDFTLVSGAEIYLKRDLAEKVRKLAKRKKAPEILFVVRAPITLQILEEDLHRRVSLARTGTAAARRKRIAAAPEYPAMRTTQIQIYDRNPDVVAEVLVRAGGFCEGCKKKAPFERRTDGTPYLEVHHLHPLSAGGKDKPEKAKALCPNCHRRVHHGT